MSQQASAEIKLDAASGYYKKIEETISELSALVCTVYPEFSFEVAMRQFDYLLQLLLLTAGFADNNYKSIENRFVSKISRYSSLVHSYNEYLKLQGGEKYDYTWQSLKDMISTLTKNEKNEFIRQLYTICTDSINEFIHFFAPVDSAVKGRSFLKELTSLTEKILCLFTVIDGDGISAAYSEAENAFDLMQEVFTSKWVSTMQEFE